LCTETAPTCYGGCAFATTMNHETLLINAAEELHSKRRITMTDLSTPSADAPLGDKNDNDRDANARQQAYLDALDEVHTRFVLNVPDSELERADRILFQIEQAWWFYEDFLVDASRPPRNEPDSGEGGGTNDNEAANPPMGEPLLPSMNFRQFAEKLFEYSPLLRSENFPSMWSQFSVYRKKIGTYGCILLSPDRKFVVLVQLWNSKTHMFPSGKINQGEPASDAAIRETYEETGFDVSCKQGLTAEWKESNPELITWDATLTEGAALTFQEDSGKKRTCYVVPNVPKDFPFGAIARKEVSRIAWHPIDSIPKHSFAVVPFLGQLKSWIRTTTTAAKGKKTSTTPKRDRSNPKPQRTSSSRSKSGTPGRSRPRSRSNGSSCDDNDRLVASGLAEAGDDCRGWSEEDMFRTNEILLGRKITYDGNPHAFAESGGGAHGTGTTGGRESVVDPHAFRVVGGSFLNAPFESPGGIASLAPPPDASKLQPLFRTPAEVTAAVDRDGDRELQPFFSDDGVTPWGMVVEDARVVESAGPTRRPEAPAASAPHSSDGLQETGQDLLKLLQQASGTDGTAAVSAIRTTGTSRRRTRKPADEAFPTDAQITASSQSEKLGGGGGGVTGTVISPQIGSSSYREKVLAQYEADMLYIQEWVANLPKPRQALGGRGKPFVLDADAIMAQLEPIFYPNTSTGTMG
jgi:mRNA-decapping enzyme subunit 2